MSDATNPAVVPDAQRGNGDEVRLGRLVERVYAGAERFIDEDGSTALRELYEAAKQPGGTAHIERLEAERDALLAEHEAAGVGAEWGEFTDDEWADWLAAYENVERVRNG